MTLPAAMTTTQSLMSRTTSLSCPSRLWVRAGFTPAIGSSSMTTFGSLMSARAISSSLRWPPESVPAKSSFFRSSLNRVSRSMAFSVLARSWLRQVVGTSARRKLSPRCPCAPSSMFCSTVRRDSALVSWKVRTTPSRATWCGASMPSGRPSNDHVPVLGWSNPVSRLNSVVLPAPLGPIRPVMPPRCTSRWSTDTAVRPPNVRVTPSTTMAGSGLATPTSHGRSLSAAWATRRGASPVRQAGSGAEAPGAAPEEAVAPEAVAPRGAGSEPGRFSAGIEHHLSSVAEDALWSEDQQQHESEPDQHEPDLSHVGRREQVLGDDSVADQRTQAGVGELDDEVYQHRADDRTEDAGRAAEDEGGVGQEGVGVLVLVGVRRRGAEGVDHPAQGAEHTAEDQRLHLVDVDVLAERAHRVLVLADGLHHPAPGAAHQQPDEQAGQRDEDPPDHGHPQLGAAPLGAEDAVAAARVTPGQGRRGGGVD